jgi:hypothetical protein
MATSDVTDDDSSHGNELEFFGVKLKVKDARLAELLNSSVTEDVQVIGARARDVFATTPEDDARAEHDVEERMLLPDDSVQIRLHEVEDS